MQRVLDAIQVERELETARHEAKMSELARIEEIVRGNGDAPQPSPPQAAAEPSQPLTSPEPPSDPPDGDDPVDPPVGLRSVTPRNQGHKRLDQKGQERRDQIVAWVEENPGRSQLSIRAAFPDIPRGTLPALCLELEKAGRIKTVGERRSKRYFPPSGPGTDRDASAPPPPPPPPPDQPPKAPGHLLQSTSRADLYPKTPLEKELWEEIKRQPQTAGGLGIKTKTRLEEVNRALAGMTRRGLIERKTNTAGQPMFYPAEGVDA